MPSQLLAMIGLLGTHYLVSYPDTLLVRSLYQLVVISNDYLIYYLREVVVRST